MVVAIPKLPGELPTSQPRWVGQPVKRIEDPSLVTGQAEFTDNLKFPGMLHCAYLRSPHPHAKIVRIDTGRAQQVPGVVAVMTGQDAQQETGPLWGVPFGFTSYCLGVGKVRFSGEPVAAVAAISRQVAEDAADLIEVEYEPLPAVVDARRAMEPGAPLLYEEQGTNVILQRDFKFGDLDAAFAAADLVVRDSYRFPRVSANPMETSGLIARWDPLNKEVTAWGTFQTPLFDLPGVSAVLRLPANRIRLIAQPYGGAFGSKSAGTLTRYLACIALLSKRSGGRPVKWIEDRIEHLRGSGTDAWERWYEGELALTSDGKATAVRVKCLDDYGAWVLFAGMPVKPLSMLTGCYEIPACEYDLTVVATNKNFQGAYRGYGPPPHAVLVERLMDKAAQALQLDPAEVRRRNFIPPERFPYTLPTGGVYDSGDYGACLDALLELSQYDQRRRAQAEARGQGRLVGLGLVSTVEVGVPNTGNFMALLAGQGGGTSTPEGAAVRIDASGNIVAEVGFSWGGQGQHTFVTQLLADYFGVDPQNITVRTVDSQSSPTGTGPIGSRQSVTLAGAVLGAAERVKDKLAKVAAILLEANPADLELWDGMLRVRGAPQRAIPVGQVAGAMIYRSDLLPPDVDGSPEASYVWNAPGASMPDEQGRSRLFLTAANAVHLAEVEVDRDTGVVNILGYWIVDDCGTRLNPAIVDGQIQGGLAQGIGAALLEEYVYDEAGERLSSTFMDYLLPTIHEVPLTQKLPVTTPSPFTPLGAKGTGESAIHTTPAALYCAVNDALAPLGTEITQLPMSPARVWHAMQRAGQVGGPGRAE